MYGTVYKTTEEFRAWNGIFRDLTLKYTANGKTISSASGRIDLLPTFKSRRVEYHGRTFELNTYFETYDLLVVCDLLDLTEDDYVIINGEIDTRTYGHERKYLKSTLKIKSIVKDEHKGKRSPLTALLVSSDPELFKSIRSKNLKTVELCEVEPPAEQSSKQQQVNNCKECGIVTICASDYCYQCQELQ